MNQSFSEIACKMYDQHSFVIGLDNNFAQKTLQGID